MSNAEQAAALQLPSSGAFNPTALGTGPRARIEKDRTTGRWMCTVAIGQAHTVSAFDTFEQAMGRPLRAAGSGRGCGRAAGTGERGMSVPVPYMADAVRRYVDHGIPPGSFLIALFSNDLKEAFRCADEANTAAMRDWVIFMINEMPCGAQGSPERVREWIAMHEARRAGEAARPEPQGAGP